MSSRSSGGRNKFFNSRNRRRQGYVGQERTQGTQRKTTQAPVIILFSAISALYAAILIFVLSG
jgi:hypothetical protein